MDQQQEQFKSGVKQVYSVMVLVFCVFGIMACLLLFLIVDPNLSTFKSQETEYVAAQAEADWDLVENGIHVRTGLVEAQGLMETVNNCTNCHSAKLITQNRMSSERWAATIDWMQETQNLWDLGKNEEIIINYLVTNYPPAKKGRRQALINIEWYELED